MSGIYSQIRVSFAALVIIFLKVNQLGFPTVDLTRVTERAHAQIVASLNKFSGKIWSLANECLPITPGCLSSIDLQFFKTICNWITFDVKINFVYKRNTS